MSYVHPFREWREGKGWSQKQAGAKLSVDEMTVSRWERGERIPRRGLWSDIRNLTGLEPEHFIEAAAILAGRRQAA